MGGCEGEVQGEGEGVGVGEGEGAVQQPVAYHGIVVLLCVAPECLLLPLSDVTAAAHDFDQLALELGDRRGGQLALLLEEELGDVILESLCQPSPPLLDKGVGVG